MDPAYLPTLGPLLRRYRRAAKLTQEKLADHSGVSISTISDLERGLERHSRPDTLALLADALGLSDRERANLEFAAHQHSLPSSALPGIYPAKRSIAVPPLVGRARELTLLERHLAGAGPPVLVLTGEPGIGKTRLLRESADRGREQGWTVLEGGCQRRSGQEPYAPLLAAVNRTLAQRSVARQKLDLQGCAWLVRLLPELAETSVVPVPQWSLPPEQERRLMFAATRRYLTNIAGPSGTLLVMDDLQWAGQDALDLLAALVRTPNEPVGRDLRVIAAYRSTEVRVADPLSVLLTDLAREELATQVELGPLAPKDVDELLTALLADLPGDRDELQRRVAKRVDGVPYFLVSCAQAVHDEGYEGDGYGQAPGDGGEVAAGQLAWTVAQSIRQRMAQLPEAARELMNVLAVSGREAAIPVLLTVATRIGLDRAETLTALDLTCQAGLVEDREEAYAFFHDLIREVAMADLGAARRASLHGWVAEAILQLTPSGREPPAAELAWHFARGGDQARALPYALQAGEQAEAVYAHVQAQGYYRIALDLARELGDQVREAEVLEYLADVLLATGHVEEMLTLLEAATEIHRAAGNLDQYAWAIAHMTRPYIVLGQADLALARLRALLTFLATQADASDSGLRERPLLTEAVREGVQSADREESAVQTDSFADLAKRAAPLLSVRTAGRVYGTLALCLAGQGRCLEALPLFECAVSYDQAAGERGLQGTALAFLAGALQSIGQPTKALTTLETASRVAAEAKDLNALWLAEANRGELLFERGDFAEGLCHMQQALEVAEQSGIPDNIAQTLCGLAMMYVSSGEWDQALDYCHRAAQVVRTLGFDPGSLSIALHQGRIYLARGESELAQECLQEAIQKSELTGDTKVLVLAHVALAEANLLHGEAATALACLDPLLARTGPYEQGTTELIPLIAWAYLELGELERAATLLAECLAHAREQHYHLLLADALRIQALLALRQGRWQDAEAALDEALALAHPMPYPYAEAKALYVYGDLHAACGEPERARERYEAALAILDRLGERLYAEHVEWALGEVQHH